MALRRFSFYQDDWSPKKVRSVMIASFVAIGIALFSLLTPTYSRAEPLPDMKACAGQRYTLPGPLPTEKLATGLTTKIDSPQQYTIYGNSITDLRAHIDDCAVRRISGDYHAATSYNISWDYKTIRVNGKCQISDVRVGLHINQYMPAYDTTSADSVAAPRWDSYISALKVHEQRHIDIDTLYARQLTDGLKSTPAVGCSGFEEAVDDTVDYYLTKLKEANKNYDKMTGHGASQGAIL